MEVKNVVEYLRQDYNRLIRYVANEKMNYDNGLEMSIGDKTNEFYEIRDEIITFIENRELLLEAYKGMWGELKRKFPEVIELEQKYLGGKF